MALRLKKVIPLVARLRLNIGKLMESFLPKKTPWSRVYAARKKLMEVADNKKRRYLPGWSAKKVAETIL